MPAIGGFLLLPLTLTLLACEGVTVTPYDNTEYSPEPLSGQREISESDCS